MSEGIDQVSRSSKRAIQDEGLIIQVYTCLSIS